MQWGALRMGPWRWRGARRRECRPWTACGSPWRTPQPPTCWPSLTLRGCTCLEIPGIFDKRISIIVFDARVPHFVWFRTNQNPAFLVMGILFYRWHNYQVLKNSPGPKLLQLQASTVRHPPMLSVCPEVSEMFKGFQCFLFYEKREKSEAASEDTYFQTLWDFLGTLGLKWWTLLRPNTAVQVWDKVATEFLSNLHCSQRSAWSIESIFQNCAHIPCTDLHPTVFLLLHVDSKLSIFSFFFLKFGTDIPLQF